MRRSPYKWLAGIAAALFGASWLLRRDSSGGGTETDKIGKVCLSEDGYRAKVVEITRAQVGKRDLDTYFADAAPMYVGQKPEWCGIFALWVLHQAGLARDKQWKVGLGFILTKPRPMPSTSEPKPGDIAYFENLQHQAVVLSVHADYVELANGNGQGGVVSLSKTDRTKAKAYYSIAPHIAHAQQECKS